MGNSIEEMLNVTIKRINAIMENCTMQEALTAETHNLINAAIALLETGYINIEKTAESLESLQEAAKSLYIESLIIRENGLMHLSGELMKIILYCKKKLAYGI